MHFNWLELNVQFRRISVGQLKDRSRNVGTTRRIVESLRDQIATGVYAPGDRLPSTRALAVDLGVSRTTVTAAFDQLISEGYVVSRQGSASVVAEIGPMRHRQPDEKSGPAIPRLSSYAQRLSQLPEGASPVHSGLAFNFRYGDLSAADFPTLLWRRALTEALLKTKGCLAYGVPAGNPVLRKELQGYLWRARGIRCESEQIVVVSGSQQGLDLCARVLVDTGDRVVMEEPGYVMARHVFVAAGASVIPVPCDDGGLDAAAVEDVRDAVLAYVTPSHQYPLGGVLSVGRREALLRWADETGAYILEDDYDGEYRYDVKPIPPLYQSRSGRVIYLGTISKTLSPTLRLGYLVLPENLVQVFSKCKQAVDRHSPAHDQEAFASLLESGAYERHVRKMRRVNAERRAALIEALRKTFDNIEVVGSSAGLHLVVWFNGLKPENEVDLAAEALKLGVGIYPVDPLYAGQRPRRAGFVFGYATTTPAEIKSGIELLRRVLGNRDAFI
ncbi:PLP-dependent aminotransferase family protein [Rhizobium sp. 007]|uniref:MocR-like pyridoxine biosynthesis transcription factor PdxR n=1 Tax=Rhizobium sp. 007 TaxID=2785056 RepID=UPI00188FBA11|nr:PLP-dependent aminotransferase family protein [Rhizobium sp. 007]QPB18417.1 PLP-dependent aminotransferase family protein [Rhizobium sp. 007]